MTSKRRRWPHWIATCGFAGRIENFVRYMLEKWHLFQTFISKSGLPSDNELYQDYSQIMTVSEQNKSTSKLGGWRISSSLPWLCNSGFGCSWISQSWWVCNSINLQSISDYPHMGWKYLAPTAQTCQGMNWGYILEQDLHRICLSLGPHAKIVARAFRLPPSGRNT